MSLQNDIETLRTIREDIYPDHDGWVDEAAALDRVASILSPLSSMPPEQLDAMLTQVTSLRAAWLDAAEHKLTDAEYERHALIAGGYQALAEALRAVKR